ncbi:MAG: YjgP/YjgQ family permease [Lentisphaerae bacterium]|nr:YjgP/YjgQ family permease [Lentisphaerota bacterium]
MRTIDRYVLGAYVTSFAATLVIFTFILSIGAIFEIVALLARGVPWKPILLILLWGFPSALTFSIPMSALTAALLVFGRMAADGEILAMRACGIRLWRVMRLPLLVAGLLAAVCLYINDTLSPLSHHACRSLITSLGARAPVDLLEEGRFVDDFKNLSIYIGKKKGDRIYNVRIYDTRRGAKREIHAASGHVTSGPDGDDLVAELFDVSVDPFSENAPGPGYMGRTVIRIPNVIQQRKYRVTRQDLSLDGLLEGIFNAPARYPWMSADDLAAERMAYAVEINKRLCLALACFSFVLLGIPLGVRAHRRQSSVGVAISLFLVFNFYLFVIAAEAVARKPLLRPDLIVWCPVAISLLLGWRLVARSN